MSLSFAPCGVPVAQRRRRCASRLCRLRAERPGGAGGVDDPDDMSYDSELRRKRMLDAAAAYKAAKGPAASAPKQKAPEDLGVDLSTIDLDEMDDIVYNRGPAESGKVNLFGGWLDDSVAGRRRTRPDPSATDLSDLDPSAEYDLSAPGAPPARELAAAFFARGTELFNRGSYRAAETHFVKAVELVGGPVTRVGGQYELWTAQARDAGGDKAGAKKLLTRLSVHPDEDVRKVAEELLFILCAPQLALSEDSYIKIPTGTDIRATSKFAGAGGAGAGAASKNKPEKYSLEWFMEKKREEPIDPAVNTVLIAAIAALTLLLLTLAFGTPRGA